jgi:NTP pyrophosphatase (non-canonical NTP hydrolase)
MDDYKHVDYGGLKDYQNFARGTAIYPYGNSLPGLMYTALGLAGEAGECADAVKKLFRDHYHIDAPPYPAEFMDKIKKEMGDVMWYLANMCEELGIELADIAALNLEKLYSRKERGVLHGSGDDR